MAKQPFLSEIEEEKPLWRDRKRILGMPLSFTVYEVNKDRFTTRKGLFRTETNEILLYRILDIRLVRTLGQKIFGVGTITLYSADQTHETLEIKNIAKPEAVRKSLSRIIEKERGEKGLTGREIYGAAGLMQDGDAIPNHSFADLNGDGIPD